MSRVHDVPLDDTSFARGLRLLLVVAERPGARADELAAQLETPVSTVYRYLRTLVELGFVDRRGSRYHLGSNVLIGGSATVASAVLVAAAGPVLALLAERSNETAVLARRVGTSVVSLDVAEPVRPLRIVETPGEVRPLGDDAVSLVLLAHAPDEVVATALAARGRTPRGWAAGERDRLARVVESGGWSSTDADPDPIVTVAVPILRTDGIAGALALRGPAARCDERWVATARTLLADAARAVVEAVEGS